MAKIKPLLGELAGSVAGNTFSHNRGGAYLRARRTSVNRGSAAQQASREALAHASATWHSLSAAARSAWAAYAADHPVPDTLGNLRSPTAHQAYVSLNANAVHAGYPPVALPPIAPFTLTVSYAYFSGWALSVLVWGLNPDPLPADTTYQLLASPAGSAGRDPNFRTARHAAYSRFNGGTGYQFYSPLFGPPGLTQNFWIRIVNSAGQLSTPVKSRVIIP